MKIRSKLILLMLTVSVLPMLAAAILTRISNHRLSRRISHYIEESQLADSIEQLSNQVYNYKETVITNTELLILSLRTQSREVEKHLAMKPPEDIHFTLEMPYGQETLESEDNNVFAQYPETIRFNRQGLFFADNTDVRSVWDDLLRLWSMTGVYHEIYELNRGRTLWHYTTLENGLHTNYPGGGTLPTSEGYDPRNRDWYLKAKQARDTYNVTIGVDASTDRLVVTASKSVFYSDGTFAGVTAIDKTISGIFSGYLLSSQFADVTETFLVGLGEPGQEVKDQLNIYLHKQEAEEQLRWKKGIHQTLLESANTEIHTKMIEDMKAGIAGHQFMDYQDQPALWVYSDRMFEKAALVMIVPIKAIAELAQIAQSDFNAEYLKQLRYSGLIILVIIIIAVILSIIRARRFTVPINQLTDAASRLAEGDFTAQASITSGDELQVLSEVFNDVGPKLKELEKTQQSLALARAIQQNLLPKNTPALSNFDIAGCCRYSDETGGDYFDFLPLSFGIEEKIGIVLGDVTGHGIGAALLMASARSLLRNASRYFTGNLSLLMSDFNDQLSEDTGDDKFITLFFGILENSKRSLTWASGGHDPALWYHHQDASFEELPNTGALMGYMKGMEYEHAGPIILEAGDIILIGTDGIWEAENSDSQQYGKERLQRLIQDHAQKPAESIVNVIIDSVEAFTQPETPSDDVTLIIIKAI